MGITLADVYGDHQVGCGGNGDRIHRHDSIHDALFSAAPPAALDVTVMSTMRRKTVPRLFLGMLFRWGRRGRWQLMLRLAGLLGFVFVPLAETLGGWCQEAITTFRDRGRIQGHRLDIPTSECTLHLFQRLSISLWKGNSSLWIRRQPTISPAVDGLI